MALTRPRRRQLPFDRHLRRPALVIGAAALVAASTHLLPARAQAPGSFPPVSIALNPLVPVGQSLGGLALGPQTLSVVVSNTSNASLVNQQTVVRLPLPPSFIASVSDGVTNVGVIDNRSGYWYHTVALIPPSGQVTFTVSWQALCPGQWPIAARMGDRLSSIKAAWIGTPNPQCSPDEISSPQPSSYYSLPWPPTLAAGTATTATIATAVTTATGTPNPSGALPPTTATVVLPGGATAVIVGGNVSATLPGGSVATTTVSNGAGPSVTGPPASLLSIGGTTTAVVRPVLPSPATTTTASRATNAIGAPSTTPSPSGTAAPSAAVVTASPSPSAATTAPAGVPSSPGSPGLVSIGAATTTQPSASVPIATTGAGNGGGTATTRKPNVTTTTKSRTATTGEVLCRTVGGVRYCAAKSSVYKEGQKKATEVAPKKAARTTKKKR